MVSFQSPAPSSAPSSLESAAARLTADVAIVGGGIVGLTLAAGLRASGLRVAVLEAQTAEQAAARQRAYAFSLTSGDIFKDLGLWNAIASHITHFSQVHLSDGDSPQVVRFRPQDLGTPAVYYAAEHRVLMGALQQAVQTTEDTAYLCSAQVIDVQSSADGVSLQVQQGESMLHLQASLLVAADGMRSQLRQQADIDTFGWRYWQSCITAVVEPEYFHDNIAYERFWPSGPFAILPLPGNRCQIVWTAPHAEAQALLALPKDEFLRQLQQRFGAQMGRLTLVSKPFLFPVQLMQSQHYVQPRLALIGDAAHCCHPVGGQGLNMGIRDAAALAEILTAAHRQGQDLGSLVVLRRYQRWRRLENWVILSFTDLLNRSFSNRFWPLVRLRRLGLWALQHIAPLRRLALSLMTGRLGRRPQLTKYSASDL